MFEVGRLCLKIAGRDAGKKCVVVEKLEGKYVMIDGLTRRRKCNTLHLEPLGQVLNIGNASHEHIVNLFKDLGHEVKTTKPKQKATRVKKTKKVKAKKEVKQKK
ncbi:hypothetical protein J4399_02440 [Candidatus Woesearchaeota archaeon]|nr:hypothetical protein [Candidatus Woesearchaeota archaeon]